MARITVEDCLEQLSNRFSLVIVSADRTKQLLRGADPMVDNPEGNKEVVLALREIAAGKFRVDETEVLAHDDWMPEERKTVRPGRPADDLPPAVDEELPPEI